NLALTLGARGGVYIAGGIVPKLGSRFTESAFRERFEAKGRMRPYLAAIPTYVITHRLPAFLGCAAALRSRSLIAWPRPRSGIGITAIPENSGRSRRRSIANRFAAASARSPR